MDSNELDKIIKEKLNNNIKPSKEFEQKIIQKIEEEKKKATSQQKLTKIEKTKKQKNQICKNIIYGCSNNCSIYIRNEFKNCSYGR